MMTLEEFRRSKPDPTENPILAEARESARRGEFGLQPKSNAPEPVIPYYPLIVCAREEILTRHRPVGSMQISGETMWSDIYECKVCGARRKYGNTGTLPVRLSRIDDFVPEIG